jgi:hypothetical protein
VSDSARPSGSSVPLCAFGTSCDSIPKQRRLPLHRPRALAAPLRLLRPLVVQTLPHLLRVARVVQRQQLPLHLAPRRLVVFLPQLPLTVPAIDRVGGP